MLRVRARGDPFAIVLYHTPLGYMSSEKLREDN